MNGPNREGEQAVSGTVFAATFYVYDATYEEAQAAFAVGHVWGEGADRYVVVNRDWGPEQAYSTDNARKAGAWRAKIGYARVTRS